ncbi:MAG: acyl carrier protein [Betaproteobacteria bacterium]|nr:acyl carrier protein [Betaproteobacteria bacterium]
MRTVDELPDLALYDEIITIFVECLHMTVPSLEADLLASGVLDSLALVDLLFQLETRYGIRISPATLDFDDFRSIAQIAAFVARERNSARIGE